VKVKKDTWLILVFLAAALWMLVISLAIIDLYAIQDYFGKALVDVWNEISDLYDFVLEPYEAKQTSLSSETQELVEDLRWKHYPFFYAVGVDDWVVWEQSYPYISWEDGVLYVTTEDEKWLIQMEKMEVIK